MSKVRVYINPFDDNGDYTSWNDVTSDVDVKSIGSLSARLEGSDYDVGVFTFSNISLSLNNSESLYSDIDDIKSIFRYRRAGSKVKITWQKGDTDAICGFATCGDIYPYYELTIFEGLLDDESASSDLKTSQIKFNVLSYGSIFSTIETPISSLSNGQTVLQILTILLADTTITKTITVDLANINPNYNAVVDDVSSYDETDMREVIADLLLFSNSVLYFEGDSIIVGGRVPTATVQQTLYGQASTLGLEDIVKLGSIKTGLSRTFNLWRWEDSSESARDNTSIDDHGLKVKEIGYEPITSTGTRQAMLDTYKDEFKFPRREFEVTTYLDTDNRKLLDRVNFDYPTPFYAKEGDRIALYGQAIYGQDKYPYGEYGLVLTPTEHFKVIGLKIDLKKDLITYNVREI